MLISEIVYSHYKKERESRETVAKDNFAPGHITKCHRQLFYNRTGVEPTNPIPESGYVKMELGNSTHKMLQDLFRDEGIWIEGEDFKEVEFNGLKWVYRIDGKIKLGDKVYIAEIKSIYANGFTAIEKAPKEEHVIQDLMYMVLENERYGIILYIGRDNGRMVEYHLEKLNGILYINGEKTDYMARLDSYLTRLKTLKVMIDKKVLPDREHQIFLKNNGIGISTYFQKDKVQYKSHWACGYCMWHNECWKDVYEKIQDYQFYINGEFI